MKKLPTLITLEKICNAFGITLAQFFTEDGNVLDLSDEQKQLLQTWATLTPEQKGFLNTCMESLKEK